MHSLVPAVQVTRVKEFNPDVIIAIGGGGFIPARMLRTEVHCAQGSRLVCAECPVSLP
jgi:hypoxanthine phosphoribosyltransferase